MPIIRRHGSKIKRLAMGSRRPGIDVEISGPRGGPAACVLYERVRLCCRPLRTSATTTTTGATRSSRSSSKSIRDRARQLGVTSEEVTRLLNTYFTGTAVSIYREGDNATR